MTMATRKLCAGVHVDPEFRERALSEVYAKRDRRVPPSYGFDLVPVLIHARRAQAIVLFHDLIVAGLFLWAAVWVPLAVLLIAGVFGVVYGLRLTRNLARGYLAYFRHQGSAAEMERLRFQRRVLIRVLPAAVTGSAVAVLLVAGASGSAAWPMRGGVRDVVVVLALFTGTAILATAWHHAELLRLRDADRTPRALLGGRRLSVIAAQQSHPFTVHSGYRPFVGSGELITTWSFAQRLIKRKNLVAEAPQRDEEFEDLPFRTREIVSHLERRIERLRDERNPEARLRELMPTHRIFVEGVNAGDYFGDLEHEPSRERIEDIMADSAGAARHYLTCQVESWKGEIVTTVYVHASLQGKMLYLQFYAYALMPTPLEYDFIQEVGGLSAKTFARSVLRTLTDLPSLALLPRRLGQVPRRMLADLLGPADKTRSLSRGKDIGAETSLREPAEGHKKGRLRLKDEPESEESFFQLSDILKHVKIIERQLIAAVSEFLTDRQVDTSEFEARATAILNNGVINTGSGSVDATNSVMGSQNTAGATG